MLINRIFPPAPERPANPAEPPFDVKRDRLFDTLDTLRHEAFALQNQLFKTPYLESARFERLLHENQTAQVAVHDALAAMGDVF